jgi:hypothetical protein
MIISCPLPAALRPINIADCPFKIDQLVRMVFQRRQPTATDADAPFATLADIQTLAGWNDFLAATDNTKMVLSPIFANATIPNSEALTTGGNDNTTFNGIRQYNGEGAVTVNGTFYNMASKTKEDLMYLPQESLASIIGVSNLTVYLVNRDGQIIADTYPGTPVGGPPPVAPTLYRGIPIYNFRISSVGSAGFNAPNTHQFSFDLPADWDTRIVSIKPTFDPLVDLVAA